MSGGAFFFLLTTEPQPRYWGVFRTAVLQQDAVKRPCSYLAAGLFDGILLQPLLFAMSWEMYLLVAEFGW